MTPGAIDPRKHMETQHQYEERLKELIGDEIAKEGEDKKGITPVARLIKPAIKALEMWREKRARSCRRNSTLLSERRWSRNGRGLVTFFFTTRISPLTLVNR